MDDDVKVGAAPSELHTLKQATLIVVVFAVAFGLATIPVALVLPGLVQPALNAAGFAAPVALPMYLSALVAGLVFLLVPGFRRDPGVKESEQVADTRQLVGIFSALFASMFAVWAVWALYAALNPFVRVGGNASVIVSAPLLIALGVLLARVAHGTLEQQRRDAVRGAKAARSWLDAVSDRTISRKRDDTPAVWPVVVVAGGILILSAGNAAVLSMSMPPDFAAVFGLVPPFAAILAVVVILISYRTTDRASRIAGWFMLATLVAGYPVIVALEVLMAVVSGAPVVASGALAILSLAVMAILVVPWGEKRPLAGTALARLQRRVSQLDEVAERAVQMVTPLPYTAAVEGSEEPIHIDGHDASAVLVLQREGVEVELPVEHKEEGSDDAGTSP